MPIGSTTGVPPRSPSLADYGRNVQQPQTASWNGPLGQTPKQLIRSSQTSKGDGLNHYRPTTHVPLPAPHLSRSQQASFVKSVASLHAEELLSPRIPVLKTGADVRNAVSNDFGHIRHAGRAGHSAPIVVVGTDDRSRASLRLQIESLKVLREQGIKHLVLPYTPLGARNLELFARTEEQLRPPGVSPQDFLALMEQPGDIFQGGAELAFIQAARELGYQIAGVPHESTRGRSFSQSYLDEVTNHARVNGGALVTTWPPMAIDMAARLNSRGTNVYSMSFAKQGSDMADYQAGALRQRPIDRARNHVYHLDPSLADRWGLRT